FQQLAPVLPTADRFVERKKTSDLGSLHLRSHFFFMASTCVGGIPPRFRVLQKFCRTKGSSILRLRIPLDCHLDFGALTVQWFTSTASPPHLQGTCELTRLNSFC